MHSENNDNMRGRGHRGGRAHPGRPGDEFRTGRFGRDPQRSDGPHGGGPRGGDPRFDGPRGRGRHGRAQRGDIRSATLLLLADGPMHGYQIMQAIAERTDGAWRPSPGAIYPTISQLEDEGLVTITRDGGRKLATLTDSGRAHLEENAAAMGNPFGGMSRGAGGRQSLRSAIEDVQTATRVVAKSGSDAQIASVQEILERARKAIYLVLADGPGDAGPEDSAARPIVTP